MRLHFTAALSLACSLLFAQNGPGLWADFPKENLPAEGERLLAPLSFRALWLDTLALKAILQQAPHEREVALSESPAILPIALPDGSTAHFRILAYDMMEPALASRFPEAWTFRGIDTSNPLNTIRIDWGRQGFHAMARTPAGAVFIDPYAPGNRSVYLCYYKRDYPAPEAPFTCQAEEGGKNQEDSPGPRVAGDCQFRSYRLALATTAEYSNYHGGTAPLVHAAVVTAINRVNEVFERDLGIRMVLVGNNSLLYYFNAATDPYSNNDGNAMLGQNQANIDNVIGPANYDIGHVFSTGGGGIAQLRVPCTGSKAGGVTGLSNPIGDPFYIDYVAHEMGHQFGANHTQNNNCNRVPGASMEPGSASTIMGYAGICPPDVQNNSDDYFHAISIQEISSFITAGAGNSCPAIISTANTQPSVAAAGPFTIPRSTPFRLTANGSDLNGDALTYCWEQWDPEVGVMPPLSTNTEGPMFRSLQPTASPTRYFPGLASLLANVDPTWEELPSVSRDMEFRVTVRDNNANYGCTDEQNVSLSAEGSAGPFLVTNPNTNVAWLEGQQYLVSWNVANTDLPPVSCATVDILLSYDGGNTFPVALASGIPNNGAAYVSIPAGTSTTARLMVQCSDNIFFDLSNSNFRINAGSADYSLGALPALISTCPASDALFVISVGSFGGYNTTVNLSVSGAPAGVTINLSSSSVAPGNTATLTIGNLENAAAGAYTIMVNASSASGSKSISLPLDILVAPTGISLSAPANNAIDIALAPTLSWAADANADYYELELALDAGFSTIVSNPTLVGASWPSNGELSPGTTYFWRVRGVSDCGDGPWGPAFSFETVPCITYSSTDVPRDISSGSPNFITSVINVADLGTVQDVNVLNLSGAHSWMADLTFYLTNPANTQAILLNQLCSSTNDFNISLDSESGNAYGAIPCNPLGQGGTFQPFQSLAAFNGSEMNGAWTLRVSDGFNQDGGQLLAWSLRLCPSGFQQALPVELTLFEARAEAAHIRLDWQTASETDNAGFEVQRRLEWENAFAPIGWVDGKGNSRELSEYQFLDRDAPPGRICYYRLRQLDYDGGADYSPIRSARLAMEEGQLALWPNPTEGTVHIRISEAAPATIRLLTSNGQAVLEQKTEDGLATLNLGKYPAGLYTVLVIAGRRAWQEKVVRK